VTGRWFAIAAGVIGILYIALTPPFQVPDEWSHYVRAEAIAQGHLQPRMTWQGDCASFPSGVERFVRTIYRTDVPFHPADVRQAMSIRRDAPGRSELCFSSWYTPMPYLPQVTIAFIAQFANVRPLVTFYAGRLATLAFVILLLLAAMRIAPEHRNVIAAIALLPMTMYEVASWSADAPTFAVAVLLTAVLLRRDDGPGVAASSVLSFALALCKPVYFLISLLAIATRRWRLIVPVLFAAAIGVAIASSVATQARYNARYGLHVDAREQMQCIVHDPAHFARVLGADVRDHSTLYVEQLVGRLGMNSLKMPVWLIVLEVMLLVLIATAAAPVSFAYRLLAFAISIGTIAGILLSQYLIWSVVCGPNIEGVQGRYFLPIALVASVIVAGAGVRLTERAQAIAIGVVAVIANATALVILVQRFWL